MQLPPHVTSAMLNPEFWLARVPNPDEPLIAPAALSEFNQRANTAIDIPAVLDLPEAIPAEQVYAAAHAYLPTRTLYTAEGHPLEPDAFDRVLENVLPDVPDPCPVQFGLVTQRTAVRAFPTMGVITSRPFEYALDRIQETTIDIGWPVAILTTTQDSAWSFCLTPHYWGWVCTAHIARAARAEVADFVAMEPFVVTLANRGLVSLGAEGGCTPQMGTRLPYYVRSDDLWLVAVPQRASDGSLRLGSGFVAAQPHPNAVAEFSPGYLPPTLRSIFTQAFKLLYEPYAWGGARLDIFGRDCSRLVRDVYATTGVLLPRNGNQQIQACQSQITFTPDFPEDARQHTIIDQATPGALLYLPGHIMLYLGHVDGRPFAVHDTFANGYDGVIVSDLTLGAEREAGSLLGRLTHVVTIA